MENFRPIGGRMGRPGDVANAAKYLASNLAGWVSGHTCSSAAAPSNRHEQGLDHVEPDTVASH